MFGGPFMIGREKEKAWLLEKAQGGRAELLVLYGRRRVGKTYLLENTFPDALFFTANLSDTSQLLQRFLEPLKPRLGLPAGTTITSWDDLFGLLKKAATENNSVVIWDEFQYIPQRDSAFLSIFQRWWDTVFSKMAITMVLCGSLVGMMERIALSEKSPLYGRRTGQYHLQPLDFFKAQNFLSEMTPEDRVLTYSVTGGIPLYLRHFSGYSSFAAGLLEKVLSPGEFLVEEGRFLVLEEFKKDPTSYFAILRTIAAGRTRSSEIAQLSGIPHQNLSTYLRNLLNLNLVKKELPFSLKTPKKIPLYFIDDEYLRFYFRFLLEAKETIYRERGKDLLGKILPQMAGHASMTFEKICRCWLEKRRNFERTGRWWDKNEEIDIVALRKDLLATAECKFTNQPVGRSVYRDLLGKTATLQKVLGREFDDTECYLFSRSGFKNLAPAPDLHLVPLRELCNEKTLTK